ncbi:MAG: hypothetical protein RLZZ383_1317, partial [Pseudomonadota bacterium]
DAGALRWDAPAIQLDVAVQRKPRGPFPPMFREAERRVAVGAPLALDVQPLPPPPPGFSGLVGDFAVSARVDRATVAAGGSVSWSFEIVGDGDPTPAPSPLPASLTGARLYPSAPQPRHRLKDGRWTAWNTWTTTVVPLQAGSLSLPAPSIIVFSPSKGVYETLTAEPIVVTVTPGAEDALVLQAFGEVGAPTVDDPGIGLAARQGDAGRAAWARALPVLVPAAAAPALGVGIVAAVRTLRSWRRRRQVLQRVPPKVALANLPKDPDARWSAMRSLLVEAGETADALRDRLDRARFGGRGDDDALERAIHDFFENQRDAR